jgi:hypothetical protein
MLSRFGGVGGKATRSLGGLAFALGSTPFGPFALAAAAATAAYSFFSSKLGLNNAEIIKKNKELSASIDELQGKLGEAFRGRQQAAIDLNIEGLTEAEKLNQKIALEQEFLAKEQLKRQELITENREKQNAAIAAGNKKDTKSLEAKKAFLESELQIEKATKSILATQGKIAALNKAAADEVQKRADARRQAEIDTQRLFDSLIRDELEKKIAAIKAAGKARDKQAKNTIKNAKTLNSFLASSEKVLQEDIAKTRADFGAAEQHKQQAMQG